MAVELPFKTVPLALGGLLVSLVFYAIYQLYFHPLANIPGPFAHKLSRFPWIFRFLTGEEHTWLSRQFRVHGSPVIRIAPNTLVFCSPSFLPLIYHHTANRSNAYSVSRIFGILGIQDHAAHAVARRRFQKPFMPGTVAKMQPIIADVIEGWIASLGCQEGLVDLVSWTSYLTYDVLTELCMGRRVGFIKKGRDDTGWLAEFEGAFWMAGLLTRLPWLMDTLRVLGVERLMALDEGAKTGMGRMLKLRTKFLKERLETPSNKPDILAQFLDDEHMSFEELKDNVFLLLVAGSDTSATALSEAIARIVTTPGAYKRVVTDQGIDEEYLAACTRESLRFFPPTTNPFPRLVKKGGVYLNDFFVPAGTEVYADAWNIARDKELYGEDAEVWNLDRYMNLSEERSRALEQGSYTWGYGSMVCAGRPIAEIELKIALKRFFEAFEVEIEGGEYPGTFSRGLIRHKPMYAKLRRRKVR